MKTIIVSLAIIFCGLNSCSYKQPETVIKKDSVEEMSIKKDTAVTVKKEILTRNGNHFIIIESKPSNSVSNYMITGRGFLNSSDTIKFPFKNPMSATLLTDLDKNGLEELYIITKAAGNPSFVDLIAVAVNPDNSFNEIKVEQIRASDVNKDEIFYGYMGFDSIYISGNKIVREFPVYKSSNTDEEKNKEIKKVFYQLKIYDKFNELVISDSESVNK